MSAPEPSTNGAGPPQPPSDGSLTSGNNGESSSLAPTDPPVETTSEPMAVEAKPLEDPFDDIPEHVLKGDAQEIKIQTRFIDNEVKMMRQESLRLAHERQQMVEKIADNTTKIKQNKVLPYLVSKVVEVSSNTLQSWL